MKTLAKCLILLSLLYVFASIMAEREIPHLPTARFAFGNLHTLMSKFCNHMCGVSESGMRRIPKTFLLCSMKCPGYHSGGATMTNATAHVESAKEPHVEQIPINVNATNATEQVRLRSQDGSTLIIVDSTYNQPGPF